MRAPAYSRSVFVNCPFDRGYKPIFTSIVFTVYHSGLVPRCALELDDAAEFRLDKIFRIVRECRYGIHDISHTQPDPDLLPRFNMPMELGVFLSCKRFGGRLQTKKACLILDQEPYRYQKFISDLAGQDIHAHQNDPRMAMSVVRSWLRTASSRATIPGGDEIWRRYSIFRQDLPEICRNMKIGLEELTFVDLVTAIRIWLRGNP
ncbi:MAG: hypothetical protein HY236_04405 [Acidobacteria bacterium]|nr:hypothetical protein [Acidobacteriota bacterium]